MYFSQEDMMVFVILAWFLDSLSLINQKLIFLTLLQSLLTTFNVDILQF